MNRTVKIVMWINLAVIAGLVFAYPHLMVRPGNLIPDHTKLEQDCFACHTPMLGAQSHKCVTCHKVKDIGIRTTDQDAGAVPPETDRAGMHPVP